MTEKIFVTGATGNVGREIIAILPRRGATFRVGDRSPETMQPIENAEAVPFDFLDRRTYRSAVTGCRTVFLLRPPAIANTRATMNVFIDVARTVGISQIVFLSVAGAASNPLVPHHAVEQHLRDGPPSWTILRPSFFAQNLESAYRADICNDDRLYVPAGRGRVAFIDTRDLAAVAVDALLDPSIHATQAYTLTEPATLSFAEVAALLTGELGRAIRYDPASVVGYIRHLLHNELPIAQALVQAVLHVGLRFGQAATIDPTLARLLGRAPRRMTDYIHDRRNIWARREGGPSGHV